MKNLILILIVFNIMSCGQDNRTSKSNNKKSYVPETTDIQITDTIAENIETIIPNLEVSNITSLNLNYTSPKIKGSLNYIRNPESMLSVKELTLKNTIKTIQKLQIKETLGKVESQFDYTQVAVEDNPYFQMTNWSDEAYFKSKNDLDHLDKLDNVQVEMNLNFSLKLNNTIDLKTIANIWFEVYYQDKETLNFITIKEFKLIKDLSEYSLSKNDLKDWSESFNINLQNLKPNHLKNILDNRYEVFLRVQDFKYIKNNNNYSFKKSLKKKQENRIRHVISIDHKLKYFYNTDEQMNVLLYLSSHGINLDTGFDKDLQAIQINDTIFNSSFSNDRTIRELIQEYPKAHLWNLFPGSPITTPNLTLGETLFLSYLTPKSIKRNLRTTQAMTSNEKINNNKLTINNIQESNTYLIEISGNKSTPYASAIKTTSQASYYNRTSCTRDEFGTSNDDVGRGRRTIQSNSSSSCTTRAIHGWCGFAYKDINYRSSRYMFSENDLKSLITIELDGKKHTLDKLQSSLSLTRKKNKLFLKITITKNLAKKYNNLTIHFQEDQNPKSIKYGFNNYEGCNHRNKGPGFRFASANSQNQARTSNLGYKATYNISITKTSF